MQTMYRLLMLSALAGLAFTACKPTPRTAIAKQRPAQEQQAAEETTPGAAAPTPEAPPPPAEPAAAVPQEVAASLLTVSSTRQDFSRVRPWEKEKVSGMTLTGVYLGEGRVLTVGSAAAAATYVEIALPDGSRSVPARVLRHDRDLNLALLTPVHEEDMTLFESRRSLTLGEPLKPGDSAVLDSLVRGIIPRRSALQAESNEVAKVSPRVQMPRLTLRSAQPLPQGNLHGLPILRDGKLVGLATGGNAETQSLHCINAELMARFLAGADGEQASCPVVGIEFTGLDDPVFRAYLKLAEAQGGVYVRKVYPGSAAEQAGIREGDVVTAIDGLAVDTQGRCPHPLYGAIRAEAVLHSLKPMGESLTLSISRDGEKLELSVPLDRKVLEQQLPGRLDPPGIQPRYVMWGGLLFQPMTLDYMAELLSRTKGSLPVQFLEVEDREKEFREKGVTELVMLTQIIPTPATLSYDDVGFCLVESVNGKPVLNFAEFVRLLDEPTADGLVAIGLNKAPYTIYVDRRMAEACNTAIRRNAIQQLRNLGEDATAEPAPEPAPPEEASPQPQS